MYFVEATTYFVSADFTFKTNAHHSILKSQYTFIVPGKQMFCIDMKFAVLRAQQSTFCPCRNTTNSN